MARKVYRVLPYGGDWKATLDSVFQKTFSLNPWGANPGISKALKPDSQRTLMGPGFLL